MTTKWSDPSIPDAATVALLYDALPDHKKAEHEAKVERQEPDTAELDRLAAMVENPSRDKFSFHRTGQ